MFEPLDLDTAIDHVYIGPQAGRPVERLIEQATASITVVSPFVSARYLRQLLEKQREGVQVTLVCHQISGLGAGKLLTYDALIEQSARRIDRSHTLRTYGLASCSLLAAFTMIFIVGLAMLWPHVVTTNVSFLTITGIVVWLGVLAMAGRYFWRLKTYSYTYASKLASFCWLGDYEAFSDFDTFHAKLYIIDQKTAFVGSLNFTNSGMTNNIETRVDIRDEKAARILDERARHYALTTPVRVDLQRFGSRIFHEPPNGPGSIREKLRRIRIPRYS